MFTWCHGKSADEGGFNINKHTLVDNLEDATLTLLRLVYDEIIHHGSIRSFPVDNYLKLCTGMIWNKEGRNL